MLLLLKPSQGWCLFVSLVMALFFVFADYAVASTKNDISNNSVQQVKYCDNGDSILKEEGAIVTKLILLFAQKVGCDVGDNCLLKWNTQNESAKFSIAWSKQCGPIIDEIYQLGDNGHGSTFICNYHPNNKICCWPLGYDYIQEFVICSQ